MISLSSVHYFLSSLMLCLFQRSPDEFMMRIHSHRLFFLAGVTSFFFLIEEYLISDFHFKLRESHCGNVTCNTHIRNK